MENNGVNSQTLEILQVDQRFEQALAEFFQVLKTAGDASYFHPHDYTGEAARRIAQYQGKDLYYILHAGGRILGYGMLRGWDAGYDVPSLGIAIHPTARGLGLGKLLMLFLHAAANLRGAKKIRLKVYPQNHPAVQLYMRLGYEFLPQTEDGQLVGYYEFK